MRQTQYAAALRELQGRSLRPEHLAMLRTHWAAPRRTVSMTQLSKAANYPEGYYANIQYGKLAERIAKYGGIAIPRGSMALTAIATWSADPRDARGHFAFTMRPGLAAALEELGLTAGAVPPEEANDPLEAFEGEQSEGITRHYKRESRLRQAKIAEVLAREGRLRCEVPGCGFDFELVYGATGAGYAHVHHLKPLASRAAPEKTRLHELAVVCANCHAMIHRFGASRRLNELIPRHRRV